MGWPLPFHIYYLLPNPGVGKNKSSNRQYRPGGDVVQAVAQYRRTRGIASPMIPPIRNPLPRHHGVVSWHNGVSVTMSSATVPTYQLTGNCN